MRDNDKASEVLIPIPIDQREACDRRRFIAGQRRENAGRRHISQPDMESKHPIIAAARLK
jgi:hypothetical protein